MFSYLRSESFLFIKKNVNPLHSRIIGSEFGRNWPSDSGGEYFFGQYIFSISFSLPPPYEKGMTFHYNKLESILPKDALCQVWLKLSLWFWRRRFLNSVNVFSLFLLKKAWRFIRSNLDPLHQRTLCAKFEWNWPSGSGEADFEISTMKFCDFLIIWLLKRAVTFIWTNLNHLHPREVFCQDWLELAQWVWRRRFWNFNNVILRFPYYLAFEKGSDLHLNKLESPSPKRGFLPRLVWIGPVGEKKKIFKFCMFFRF